MPAPLVDALEKGCDGPPVPTPEITAFEVPEGQPTWGFEILDLPFDSEFPNIKSFVDRTSALALLAAKKALIDAGLKSATGPVPVEEPIMGCSYGTTLGCLEAMSIFWNKVKTSNPKFAQPLPFIQGYSNSPSSLLCIEFGLRGPAATFSGGNLAGLEALMFAFDQISTSSERSDGNGEIMLVGASESLSQAAWSHLVASGLVCTNGDWSNGSIPGEGAVMLVLESEASARKRGVRVYAEIEGVNFFPIPTTPNADPITLATDVKETVQFVSSPNTLPTKEWVQPLRPDMATVATKYYTGDMLSVSAVLRTALAAGMLGEKFPLARSPGQIGIPLLFKNCQLLSPRFAIATGYDPHGSLGLVMLRNCKE